MFNLNTHFALVVLVENKRNARFEKAFISFAHSRLGVDFFTWYEVYFNSSEWSMFGLLLQYFKTRHLRDEAEEAVVEEVVALEVVAVAAAGYGAP